MDRPFARLIVSEHPAMTPLPKPGILFALNRPDRQRFLPDFPAAGALAEQGHWLDEACFSPDSWLETLQRIRPVALVSAWSTPPLPEQWLASPDCPLRYVCHVTGSVRRIVPRTFIEHGGLVSNWGSHVCAQVAEHALLLALAALRNQSCWRPFMASRGAGHPMDVLGTRSLFGLKVGIHGYGNVARALIPLLRPFGVDLHVFSEGVPASILLEAGLSPSPSLERLFAGSELLFECEGLTPLTQGCVTRRVIEALPQGACFVNVGRGALVDEEALIDSAKAGRIRLALDVAINEPINEASPFWSLPNAVLSPHIAGPTTDRLPELGRRALANLESFLRGNTPDDLVSLPLYDRST